MNNWIPLSPLLEETIDLGPLQLAWLGDAVWELHQRVSNCRDPGRIEDLHNSVVREVRADAQARTLDKLQPFLGNDELELVRRGRNRAGGGPRKGESGIYGKATGFETMIGWLFLNDPARLAHLLEHLKKP